MRADRAPEWLWLYGPPGVGKSAVGFELFAQLGDAGRAMGYIELDQLGMCFPSTEQERTQVKVANLLSALATFGEFGADGVVVSGDIAGPPMADVVARSVTEPLLCRLRARPATFEHRLRSRGAPASYAEAGRHYDDLFGSDGDVVVETDGLTVREVASRLRQRIGSWPFTPERNRRAATTSDDGERPEAPPSVVVICGPPAVGKSVVGWEVFMASVNAKTKTAYLDLGQLGFFRPAADRDNLALKARNVGRFWRTFSRSGARRLVLSGEIEGTADVEAYRQALARPRISVFALAAGADELKRRATLRAEGRALELPGDPLRGRSSDDVDRVVQRALARAQELGRSSAVDVSVDTDERSPAAVARVVLEAAGW